jgi:hypothetical protein
MIHIFVQDAVTRDSYQYFYDEHRLAALLAGVNQALQKLR